MIRRIALAVFALSLTAAMPAMADWQATVYTQYWTATSPYAQTAPYYYSKLCNQSTSTCYSQPSNGFGYATYLLPAGTYDGYVWHSSPYDWGSTNVKVGTVTVYATNTQSINLTAYPRPLTPTLKSCYGCTYAAMTPFDLIWTNGRDTARTDANWTYTYDIYTATKPSGGAWGPELVTVADAPCNPNSSGYCVWHVDGLAQIQGGAEYHWRIVAKLHFYGETYIYETTSSTGDLFQSP